MPLYGESKSRQCFVKTTKCSIKYYLCQNLSATENVSENAKIECLDLGRIQIVLIVFKLFWSGLNHLDFSGHVQNDLNLAKTNWAHPK